MADPIKPTDLAEALECLLKAGRRPLTHGDPGIGKSQITKQVADRMFAPLYGYTVTNDGRLKNAETGKFTSKRPWFLEIRTAQLDACDLRGLPIVNGDGRAHWAPPEMFGRLDERGGVVFWDEINRGTELVSNSAFQMLDQNRIGDCILPNTWGHVAAVNDLDIGARKMSSALMSRFVHLDAKTDLEDVCKYAVIQDWDSTVVAFLRFRPELLHKYDAKQRVSPNPRAWEFVSQIISQQPNPRLEFTLYAGAIGEGAAVEFMAFLKLYRELPSIDSILLNPEKSPVPTKPATLYAVSSALARRAAPKTFKAVVTYLERLPVEYNVMAIKDAVVRVEALRHDAVFTKWCIAHADVAF